MRAVIADPSGPVVADVPKPQPGADEILVRVRAAALNRIDLRMSRGMTHGTSGGTGRPCGMEWAGEIVDLGPSTTGWSIGDRVMGVGAGAFAQFTTAHTRSVFAIPGSLTFSEAATLPVGLQTMHDALITQGGFGAGQSVLIQGASSGMGLMGMQIAREVDAKLVVGTSTDAGRRERLADFGADVALDSRSDTWVDEVLAVTGGQGVDVLLDLLGGPLVTDGMRATRIGGRMINIGRVAGEQGSIDFDLHSLRRITYIGTTFRTRDNFQVAAVVAAATGDLHDAVSARRISMPVECTYPLEAVNAAFAHMERNEHFGKLVLDID